MNPSEFDKDLKTPNKITIEYDCRSCCTFLLKNTSNTFRFVSRQHTQFFWQPYVFILQWDRCQHLAIMRKLLQSSWGTLNGSINRGQPLRRSVTSKRANCKRKPILSHRTFYSLDQIVSKNKKSIFRRSCKQFTQ